jgi:hypothetical protein
LSIKRQLKRQKDVLRKQNLPQNWLVETMMTPRKKKRKRNKRKT